MVNNNAVAVLPTIAALARGREVIVSRGTKDAVRRIRTFPLKRAPRMSKLPLTVLEATLRLLTRPLDAIRALAEDLRAPLAATLAPCFTVEVLGLQSQIGSGSLPIDRLPSAGLAVAPAQRRGVGSALDELARTLLLPVIGQIADDRLLFDLRCLEEAAPFVAQLPALREALVGT